MRNTRNVGKYQLSSTIGEGTFAKVKVAKNTSSGQTVAIKIIDKKMVVENNIMYQVEREIRTMKLLNHPNIVKIYEVIGTKTKIYIVMEYVPGGQLSDKLNYAKKLSEKEARNYFQQLIDAVDYFHSKGVYHRDLKPENLLLDGKGNLKVSDFGLSTFQKPGRLLSTACGSPCYVPPELLRNQGYEGAPADVWTCGVILFEMLAGYLPFDDKNVLNLYRKIWRAQYEFPQWFTLSQKKLIARILNPNPNKRITIPEIIEDEWFQINYVPTVGEEFDARSNSDDTGAAIHSVEVNVQEPAVDETSNAETPKFINAFQLIALSRDLDLSNLFEEQHHTKRRIILGSKYKISETIKRIEAAARNASLSVERMDNRKIKLLSRLKSKKARSCFNLLAEVTEVAPTDCLVEISKSAGELGRYHEFCNSLSSLLTEETSKQLTVESLSIRETALHAACS